MKLNASHIDQLYAFTEQHFVEWYDLQTELVDHLANGIEEQWAEQSHLSFETALNREFKKFGVMGFSSIVEEKRKALNKTYWRLIWHDFKGFIRLPKIVLTMVLVVLYYELLIFSMQFHVNWVLVPSLTFIFGLPWGFLIKEHRRTKRLHKLTGKKWLFDQSIAQLGGIVHLLNFAIYFQVFFHSSQVWPTWLSWLCAFVVVLFGLLLYVALFEVVPKLRETMAKQHPEYHLALGL